MSPSYSSLDTEDVGFMDSFDVVPAEVANLLRRTKAHCASGLDGISAWMLGSFADSLSPSISSMFNLSIPLGRLPTMWKVSHVVPIPKESSKNDVSSYWPISLCLSSASVWRVTLKSFCWNTPF